MPLLLAFAARAGSCLLFACAVEPMPLGTIADEPAVAARPRFVEVAAGASHSCAREASGRVFCWGLGVHGQLGDGTRAPRARPTPVVGVTDAVSLSAMEDRTCVARADRTIWCWGRHEDWPRLFEEGWRDVDDLLPVRVEGLTGDEVLASWSSGVCARDHGGPWRCLGPEAPVEACRLEGGGVVCFGVECSPTECGEPTDHAIDGTEGATDAYGWLEAGCAIVADEVRCWGSIPGRPPRERGPSSAVRIEGTDGAVDVTLARDSPGWGPAHGCVAHGDGHVSCWGRDDWGQLGLGVERVVVTPQRVLGLEGVVDVASGAAHACALDDAGRAWCWGDNSFFQIGASLDDDVARPHELGLAVAHLAAGVAGTCVVTDGALWCAGETAWVYLDPARPSLWDVWPVPWHRIELAEPVVASFMAPFAHGDTGFPDHDACALLEDGRVLCTARVGTVPSDENPPLLTEAPSLIGADRLFVDGAGAVCGRTADGWRCESGGSFAFLLDGTITDLDAHSRSSCAVTGAEVRCGPLGGDPGWELRPVAGTEGAVSVRVGDQFACDIDATGAVSCWGANAAGVLGSTEPVERAEAEPVPGLPPAVALALGSDHACALGVDGTVWCWGHRNALGDGSQVRFIAARRVVD